MRKSDFYENKVLNDEFEFTIVDEADRHGVPGQPSVKTKLLNTASAIAIMGMLVFGPCAVSAPSDVNPVSVSAVIRVYAQNAAEHVVVPAAHQRAAERFRQLFHTVPLSQAEKLPDPDFGL